MKRGTLLAVVFAVTAGVGVNVVVRGHDQRGHEPTVDVGPLMVAWRFKPTNLKAQVDYADLIVVARWSSTYPGRVAPAAGLQFELVDVDIVQVLKGDAAVGQTLTVERVSGVDRAPGVLLFHDGGGFEPGLYLLFLRRQQNTGFYTMFNDEARFEIHETSKRVATIGEGPVAAGLRDRSLVDVIDMVAAAADGGTR